MQFFKRLKRGAISAWRRFTGLFTGGGPIVTRMEAHNANNFNELLDLYGLEPVPEEEREETTWVEPGEVVREMHEDDPGAARVIELAEVQEEEGRAGTFVTSGLPDVEPNARYRPYAVRGYASDPGDYEDYYRQEPVIRHSVDAITEIQVSASRSVQMPENLPDDEQVVDELREWCEWADGKFRNIAGGLTKYVRDAASSAPTFGFGIFEVVWEWNDAYTATNREGGKVWPHKIAYREPSTVDEWIMDDRQDELRAVKFRVGGDASGQYVLTARGERIDDQRVALCRVAGRGNNWEGISPIRPAMHWLRFKQLLGQIAAATAQKYGVPTTFIKRNADFETQSGTDQDDAKETQAVLAAKEAVEAAVVLLPDGLDSELESPSGTMPSFHELIKYCDDQIARSFSNEGSLLGHNQIGSYALAEVQDNSFMRSAPHWSRIIMEPINDLIRTMCKHEFGELPEYPKMGFRLDAMHEVSKQVSDMVALHGGRPVTEWTEEARHWAAENIGLEPDAFEADEGEEEAAPMDDQREFNGAQISSMANVVRQVATGELPEEGAIEILKLGFGISDFQARGFFTDKDVTEQPDEDAEEGDAPPEPPTQLSEERVQCYRECAERFEQQADDVQREMDRVEEELGREFARIAEEQRQWFRDRTEGLTDPEAIHAARDEAAERFEDQYVSKAEAAAATLTVAGAASLLREMGVSPPSDLAQPPVSGQQQAQLQATVRQVADEVNQRNASHMRDQRVEQITEGRTRSVKRLKTSTLAGVAAGISGRAFNSGRDATMEAADRVLSATVGSIRTDDGELDVGALGESPRIMCVRSSMLDSDVCEPCLSLDFERGGPEFVFGSAKYRRSLPPKPCLAGKKCRCVMMHDSRPEHVEAVKRLVDADFAIGDVLAQTP